MTVAGQVAGQLGRIFGDAQLRGHFGRIPFALAPTGGSAVLAELVAGSVSLSEGGAVATLSEHTAGVAGLTESATAPSLMELLAGTAKLEESGD